MSPTKCDILKGFRTIRLDDHDRKDCSSLLDHNPEGKSSGMVHVDLLTYEASHIRRENTISNLDPIGAPCALLLQIAPKKLVLRAVYGEPLPIRSIDQRNLDKIVSWVGCHPFNHRDRPQHNPPFTGSLASSKTIVYILGAPCYEDLQVIAPNGFREHVMDIVYSCGSAVEIFVINAHSPKNAREIPDKQFATLTVDIEMDLAAQRDIVLETRGEDDDSSSIQSGIW